MRTVGSANTCKSRKLQTTAGGTYIVTLPKEWVEKLRLKKGDLVSTEMEEDSLVI